LPLRTFEEPPPVVLYNVQYYYDGLAMLANGLRRAPRRLDDVVETVFGLLH
jgi:hypothetical protein